ncbi:MAG: DUF1737 domain-containing protein [Terrimicrobiaceae bacterium]|jgi:hypothetical protein
MNNIIDYKTLEGERAGDLDGRVKEQIAEGYQPYGNPYAFGRNFYQAMIKTSDQAKPGARRGF